MAPNKTAAFLGATGDSAGFCLAAALDNGYDCIALVRTPEKLAKSMEAKGVSKATLSAHLTVVQGNVRDVADVKKALQINGKLVDKIVSGIGAYPTFQWSITKPFVSKDPTVCQDACDTVLKALSELGQGMGPSAATEKPLYVNFFTMGIQPPGKPRDIPLLLVPLYHLVLASPHEDKRVMESRLAAYMKQPEAERGIRGYVLVRASLMLDGEGKGLKAVRVGNDDKPAIGYTIARKDVGTWTFENLVKGDAKKEWLNSGVSITN